MLTYQEFEDQVQWGWYPPSPSHRFLRFRHPLGDITRLIYQATEVAAELASMYRQYRIREGVTA